MSIGIFFRFHAKIRQGWSSWEVSQTCKNWQELPRGHARNHFGRFQRAFSAILGSIPGMPREFPARSQDAPEIQKMISESLRARPQDPSGTVFNNFCKLFVSQPSFHGFRSFFRRFVKARNLRIVWQGQYIQQFGHVSNFLGVWPRKCRKFVEIWREFDKKAARDRSRDPPKRKKNGNLSKFGRKLPE